MGAARAARLRKRFKPGSALRGVAKQAAGGQYTPCTTAVCVAENGRTLRTPSQG